MRNKPFRTNVVVAACKNAYGSPVNGAGEWGRPLLIQCVASGVEQLVLVNAKKYCSQMLGLGQRRVGKGKVSYSGWWFGRIPYTVPDKLGGGKVVQNLGVQ
jgi:hypothetical protein